MFEAQKLKKELKKEIQAEEVNWQRVQELLQKGARPHIGHPSVVLHKAIWADQADVVDSLLETYPDLAKEIGFSFTGDFKSPLQSAFDSQSPRMVQRLVKTGENLWQMNEYGFRICWKNVQENIDLLIENGLAVNRKKDADGMTCLVWAAYSGKTDLVQKLIKAGADCNVPDRSGRLPLKVACSRGHEDIAVLLIRHNASRGVFDDSHHDALVEAIRRKLPIATQMLIERTPEEELKGAYGQRVLKYAIDYCDEGSILLCGRLNVNRKINGKPALLYAIQKDDAQSAVALFKMGADIHVRDESGNTALMWAVKKGMMRLTKALLASNVSLEAENKNGYTARDIALENGHPAFAEAIQREAARRQGAMTVFRQIVKRSMGKRMLQQRFRDA